MSTPSEVPSARPVRGEGKFEGEGGLSAPPSPSRQKWRWRGFPGSLARGSLETFLTPKAREGGKKDFQDPSPRGLLKSPRETLSKPAF